MSWFTDRKHIFGKPGEGVHSHRFGNIAIVDYLTTIVIAMIISMFVSIPLDIITVLLFILASFLHMLFGVETSSVKYLKS